MKIRFVLATLFALTVLPLAHAGDDALKAARERLWKGNYAEARGMYEKLAKNAGQRLAATVGVSRCWRESGEYDKALQALDAALKDAPQNADLLAEKADLLFLRGRWTDAEKAANAALKDNQEQFLAHWVLARLYRDRGELKKASAELVWFIRIYSRRESITSPDELLLIGLAAVERARKDRRLNDQFQFVLTDIWKHAANLHKDFWRAEFERGKLFQEKYSYASATKAFDRVLKINPRATAALVSKGIDSLRRYQIKDAERFADQALKINPRCRPALQLKADVFLTAGDTEKAMKFLNKAKEMNPRDEEILARIAACYHLNRQPKKLKAVVAQVEKQNPKCGLFYHEFAERLEERKHYTEAEKYFKRAIDLRPELVQSRNHLGLLYMRLGLEKEAHKILDKSFDDDPFNVRVYNTLKVIRHLKEYDDLKTKHFIIRHDPKNDKLLAHFVGKYLEEIYEELAEQFQYRPKGPILIEIFNKHEMFSGRVVALPDLHTIGACTGKMIAICSPHDKSRVITKPFNWNRVMRHELVHVFNLEQTNFLVPHWFTEGLAVRAEKMPMPPQWYEIMLKRVPSGDLMNLDNIHLGFIRPGSSEEWHLAYLQSKLYVDYLIKTQGQKAVGGFLDAYRDGLDTAGALKKVCSIDKADFEKGYREYLNDLVKNMSGRPREKRLSFKQLKQKNAENPNDADVAAALGEQYLMLGNRQKARELAESALKNKENHSLAAYVKAQLLLAGGDNDGAKKLLQPALNSKNPNLKALKLLGKLEFDAKNFSEAAESFELGRKTEPYDNYWLIQLARCYRQNGDDAKLITVLEKLAPTDVDDMSSRVYLAKLLAKAERHADAERYAREALEINVNDAEAQQLLQDALRAQNKEKELKELQNLLQNR